MAGTTKKWRPVFHELGDPVFISITTCKMGPVLWTPPIKKRLDRLGIKPHPHYFETTYGTRVLYMEPSENPLLSALVIAYSEAVLLAFCRLKDKAHIEAWGKVPYKVFNIMLDKSVETIKDFAILLNSLFCSQKGKFTEMAEYLNNQLISKLPKRVSKKLNTKAGGDSEKIMEKEKLGLSYLAEVLECSIDVYIVKDKVMDLWTVSPLTESTEFNLKILRLSEKEMYILYTKDECDMCNVITIDVAKDLSNKINTKNELLKQLRQLLTDSREMIKDSEKKKDLHETAQKILAQLRQNLFEGELKVLAQELKQTLESNL